MQLIEVLIARLDHHGHQREVADQDMLTPLWFPIHMRLLEQSRFKPCLWCIYFLLESKDLHAVGWLGWGFLSICDHLKSLKMGDIVRSIKKQIICCGLKSKGWVKISCFFVLHDKNIQTIIWDYYQNYIHQINFYFRKFIGNTENQTRGCWVRSTNATSLLCRPPNNTTV